MTTAEINTEEFNFMSLAMTGMSLIGQALQFRNQDDVQVATFIIMGHYDKYLKCASFFTSKLKIDGQLPKTEEELEVPEVLVHVERIKNHIRGLIQQVFREAERYDQAISQAKKEELLAKLRESNKPHTLGTVAEIATKYGMSKSEVRRHKADGTLESVIMMKSV